MTDKQTTWESEYRESFGHLKAIKHDILGNSLDRSIDFIESLIQEEREKVIAEFISGERCSDCGKLITDGSSGCCKDCWENI